MACRHYLELAKLRVSGMVLVTTAVGYVLGSDGSIRWPGLALVVAGTGLAVVGAAAINQLLEIDRDAKMRRTRNRPLPAGRVSRTGAFAFGMGTIAAGLGLLNQWVSPLCCLLALVDVLLYVLVYTPLKTRTSLNTLVGSVCGALPPAIGWAAAAGGLKLDAALLPGILLLWQVPHSLSFVWLYRDDYAAAGYRMLPVLDLPGRLTCLAIILWWLALHAAGTGGRISRALRLALRGRLAGAGRGRAAGGPAVARGEDRGERAADVFGEHSLFAAADGRDGGRPAGTQADASRPAAQCPRGTALRAW